MRKKNNQFLKKDINRTIYWTSFSFLLWTLFFLLEYQVVKKFIVDAISIPSIVFLCFYGLAAIFKLGFLEGMILSLKNSLNNSTIFSEKRKGNSKKKYKAMSIKQYRKERAKKSWLPILVGLILYSILTVLAFLI